MPMLTMLLTISFAWAQEDASCDRGPQRGHAVEDTGGPSCGDVWDSPTLGPMRWVPAGSFTARGEDGGTFEVEVEGGFWMMAHEVTQAEWIEVMGLNPSRFFDCSECPVESVSWGDVMTFLGRVSARDGTTYRLPTEGEWELAARGGEDLAYAGANDVGTVGWVRANSGSPRRTHEVCQKEPNAYGLCDMSGNVWEWVSSGYGAGTRERAWGLSDLDGFRGIRGGSWLDASEYARVSERLFTIPADRNSYLGFRLIRVP